MHYVIVFVLLMTFVAGLGLVARRLDVPYPILFVIGGLFISFIPHLPRVTLDPEFIFFLFLPPLLYRQAFETSWRDFRRYLRAISLLAIGLVLATIVSVAYAAHWMIPGVTLATGFVLGAIVSPPDAIAASAIAQRLGLPRNVVTILEGESLVNDSTGLVALNISLAAMMGSATIKTAWLPGEFVYVTFGGIVIGLLFGWLVMQLQRRLGQEDPKISLTLSLITPFASYLAAQPIQVSGILAVVTTGLYLGWKSPEYSAPGFRLQSLAVWELIVYLLNGIVFVLIGLQLPIILQVVGEYPWQHLLGYAVVVNLACIFARLGWIFPGAYLPRWLFPHIHRTEPKPKWTEVLIIGWSGMRGVVSLAAALSLASQGNFPQLHLIQFLAFSVILTTLVLQGLTLPPLIRFLHVGRDNIAHEEETLARTRMNEVIVERINEVRAKGKFPESVLDRVATYYTERALFFQDPLVEQLGWSEQRHQLLDTRKLRRMMILAERETLLTLRRTGQIGDDVMHKIEHELDLEAARLKL